MEFLTEYAWIAWIAVILIFVIIEVSTLEFTFLMLAIGSTAGLVSGLLGAPGWAQILIAAVASLLLLFAVKPPLTRRLQRGGDQAKSNVDALLGLRGHVVTDFSSGGGQVKLANGETWTARLSTTGGTRELSAGEMIEVTAIDGATAIVVPEERAQS